MSIAPTTPPTELLPEAEWIPTRALRFSAFSASLYGAPEHELDSDGLLDNIRDQGVLVPLVIAPLDPHHFEVLSGNRRLACARHLELDELPCQIRDLPPGAPREQAVLDYNLQRQKNFSQRMREADALEHLLAHQARDRRQANLRQNQLPGQLLTECLEIDTRPQPTHHRFTDCLKIDTRETDTQQPPECLKIDTRPQPATSRPASPVRRTDQTIARLVGLGGKDSYRQARAIWKAASQNDPRASAAVTQLDAATKTIHAAYKDLRRRDRFTNGFQPTPYDVWPFRHDPAFGTPHPGAIPPAIIAHAIHYFCPTSGLVVDPMAGGGTTLDVCQAMGRSCLSYDLHPTRPDIKPNDIMTGLPEETAGCDLIFCDPPYHNMLAGQYGPADAQPGVGEAPFSQWLAFLQVFSRVAFLQLKAGGHVALLLANQTEKGLPAGSAYIDHVFLGYGALLQAGFQPIRRIHCPMSGGYQPQQIRQARDDGRLLGQVRDLLVMRKPLDPRDAPINLARRPQPAHTPAPAQTGSKASDFASPGARAKAQPPVL